MKSEQGLFEEYMRKTYLLAPLNTLYLNDDTYVCVQVDNMWRTWQESAQRQGYKLVPVETLEECLSWACCASSESWNDEQRDEIDKHYKVIEKAMIGAV